MRTADGCPVNTTDEVVAAFSFPVELTLYADRLEAALFATKNQLPSSVIAPESGLAPVETDEGESKLSAPVAGLNPYCET
jgi:hypothetical protein